MLCEARYAGIAALLKTQAVSRSDVGWRQTKEAQRMRPEFPIRQVASMVMAMLILTGCGSASDETTASTTSIDPTTSTVMQTAGAALIGTWKRTGGDFSVLEGMVVEVDESGTTGTIVMVPRNPYGFQVGDVKWSEFTGVSFDRIRIRDLVRDANTGLPSHVTGVITMTDDGAMFELTFPSTGTRQVWSRLP
jgi:hypothetical protein